MTLAIKPLFYRSSPCCISSTMSVNSLLRSDLPLIPVLCGLSQAGGSVLYMSYWAISTIFTVCPVQATPTSGCSQFVAVENDKIPEMPVFPGISGTWKVLNYYSHSANSSIWECIWGGFTGKTFANMLIFCLIIWGSLFFQYQNSITKIEELQEFQALTAAKTSLNLM